MSNDFHAGQRWISDTESDLGLGTVLEVEQRQISVVFLATGETRIYARESAPLTRVAFQAGDVVTSHEGWQMRVDGVDEKNGLLTYYGLREDNGTQATLNESALDNFLQFRSPRDRLFAGLIDGQRWFSLRRSVFMHRHHLAHSAVRGLMGARVSILPHQIYIAAEALQRHHPRLLLADEVGLGKTIEAGMIVHGSLINERVSRVLIVVPSPLLYQWLVEMLRKFNLNFHIMDSSGYEEMRESAPQNNPFLAEQLVLCSLDTLMEDDSIGDAVAAADWDMLVVDEAHHLRWEPNAPSAAYTLIEELTMETPSVLLLSATPEQLGTEGHFARLRLLDPERFGSLEQFIDEQSRFGIVADLASRLSHEQALEPPQIDALESLLAESFDQTQRRTLGSSSAMAMSEWVPKLIHQLIDHHGTSRLMFRNTRQAISGFPARRLHTSWLDDDSLESKAQWLLKFLPDQYPNKVLLICSSRATVQALAEHLRKAGTHSAQFHEGMSIVERDRAAAWFADAEEDCRLLLCSEIGSEGRNFQFLHTLVMLELPDVPDLLEQRIGRLDRIGQSDTVHIHVPVAPATRDALLLNWYHEGLDAFERISTSSSMVRQRMADRLEPILAQFDANEIPDSTLVARLIQDTRQMADRLEAELEAGRDRLLELNSNRPERVQQHLDELARMDRNYALQDFMDAVFDRFGVEVAEQRDHWIIHPSDHMQVAHFPRLPASGMSITFDRATALAREDFTYLTWDHPMVTAVMDLILDEGFGQADCQVIKTDKLPKNLTFVEASYVLQCSAERALNIERYLPAQVQSWSVGIDGKDYSDVVATIELDSLKVRYDRTALRKVVLKNRSALETLIQRSAVLAADALPAMVADARQRIDEEYREASERLNALSRVNPSVRQEEIDALSEQQQTLLEALEATHARPVSLRVMFNT